MAKSLKPDTRQPAEGFEVYPYFFEYIGRLRC